MSELTKIMKEAQKQHLTIPAFNVPYIPMIAPLVQAAKDENAFALIQAARADWEKFEAVSLESVAKEFEVQADSRYVALHLDHIPVIDEDGYEVDYMNLLQRAIGCGFQSVMLDASRLDLDENIRVTEEAVTYAHAHEIPLEAELGTVMGHEAGPLPPYEELFLSKQGFTKVKDAERYVRETGCDWLSVAIGSIHGALQQGIALQSKPKARLDIEHLEKIREATNVPIVLHGGSGIEPEYIRAGIQAGIAKINIGTEIRQAYLKTLGETKSMLKAQDSVYEVARRSIAEVLQMTGSAQCLEKIRQMDSI